MGEVVWLSERRGSMGEITYEDIANYFIARANVTGDLITNLKLQKLVYYAQAWHWTIYDEKLFEGKFEAWVHGPVLRSLYNEYKQFGWKPIEKDDLDRDALSKIRAKLGQEKVDFMEEVVEEYFGLSAYELERLTHVEDPWKKARAGLDPDQPSNKKIESSWMREYYSKFLGSD
ncbi:Panacea domain-containing protein [Sporohalobacter salinus]|uniref:Panacea domain-containing protein n=1 Tax=Sporohalobacter salinus TaxID=1494606 RepID=UPI001961758D|nr:type II toxin-antitoxin system antitoxin SocA domain-containing protein [Sporohalobacter salinus]MBM7624796.1 putative phage-associated protein [Sporohalobacter salinus]